MEAMLQDFGLQPWQDGINTCIECGISTLSRAVKGAQLGVPESRLYHKKCTDGDTELSRRRKRVQVVCASCAQGNPSHHTPMSDHTLAALEHFAYSEVGQYQCCECKQSFATENEALIHTQWTREVAGTQCLLAGEFVERGGGAIEPYIDDEMSCKCAVVQCKFCGESVEVGHWREHVKTICKKVPCALCLWSLADGANAYARKHVPLNLRGQRPQIHCQGMFQSLADEGTCEYSGGTFKEMLEHMQQHSEEHKRGYRCLRQYVRAINSAVHKKGDVERVDNTPTCLAIDSQLNCSTQETGGDRRRADGPITVSCKSPRCDRSMVVNVCGKRVGANISSNEPELQGNERKRSKKRKIRGMKQSKRKRKTRKCINDEDEATLQRRAIAKVREERRRKLEEKELEEKKRRSKMTAERRRLRNAAKKRGVSVEKFVSDQTANKRKQRGSHENEMMKKSNKGTRLPIMQLKRMRAAGMQHPALTAERESFSCGDTSDETSDSEKEDENEEARKNTQLGETMLCVKNMSISVKSLYNSTM